MNPTLPPFVQQSFDRGLDPIDDPAVQQWLLEHPETLPTFAALRHTLSELRANRAPQTRPGVRRRRWHPVFWAGAAAAALALVLLAIDSAPSQPAMTLPAMTLPAMKQPTPTETTAIARAQPLPRPDFSSTGGVVHCCAAATEIRGTNTQQNVVVLQSLGVSKRRSTRDYASLPTVCRNTPVTVRATTTVEEALIP